MLSELVFECVGIMQNVNMLQGKKSAQIERMLCKFKKLHVDDQRVLLAFCIMLGEQHFDHAFHDVLLSSWKRGKHFSHALHAFILGEIGDMAQDEREAAAADAQSL